MLRKSIECVRIYTFDDLDLLDERVRCYLAYHPNVMSHVLTPQEVEQYTSSAIQSLVREVSDSKI